MKYIECTNCGSTTFHREQDRSYTCCSCLTAIDLANRPAIEVADVIAGIRLAEEDTSEMTKIEERVSDCLRNVLGSDGKKYGNGFDPDSTFEELYLDSLDVVELVMELEDEFNISIADEDAEGFRTVGQLFEYMESHG